MKKFLLLFILGIVSLVISCTSTNEPSDDATPVSDIYFPPMQSPNWESIAVSDLGWDENKVDDLYSFLETNNTRAFIVLKDGKIVLEEYWGNAFFNQQAFTKNSNWYWASAGKTLTASLIGIAQQEGQLSITDKTSAYLGQGWTAMTAEKEALITIRHQLTMTTGLSYDVDDLHCTSPNCLTYSADAGTQWYYHNAPYSLLKEVTTSATGMDYNSYTQEKIGDIIGMQGQWQTSGYNTVYWSTAREMARFGLLVLNHGKWENTAVLTDADYVTDMISTSQTLNPSYGYLWWLNGKESIQFPGLSTSLPTSYSPNAPADLISGAGLNGQFVDLVPSKNLVVIRMGEAPNNELVPVSFHDQLWEHLKLVLQE